MEKRQTTKWKNGIALGILAGLLAFNSTLDNSHNESDTRYVSTGSIFSSSAGSYSSGQEHVYVLIPLEQVDQWDWYALMGHQDNTGNNNIVLVNIPLVDLGNAVECVRPDQNLMFQNWLLLAIIGIVGFKSAPDILDSKVCCCIKSGHNKGFPYVKKSLTPDFSF